MAEPVLANPILAADPLRIGLIGFGYWGRKLNAALRAHPGFDLCRIHLRTPDRLSEEERQQLEGVELCDRAAQLWRDPALQAVIIATPISSHYELCREALLAGKHVLVEKPLALRAHEAHELASMAHSRGLTLQTDYTWTFSPGLLRAQELVQQRWFGQLRHIQVRFHQLGRFRKDDVGPLLVVHMLSIVSMFSGLTEFRWTKRTGVGSDQHASSVMIYGQGADSGLEVTLDGSLDDPVRERSVLLFGEHGTISYRPLGEEYTLQGVLYSREPSNDDQVRATSNLELCTAEDDNLGHALSAFAKAVAGVVPSNLDQSLAITSALEQLFATTLPGS